MGHVERRYIRTHGGRSTQYLKVWKHAMTVCKRGSAIHARYEEVRMHLNALNILTIDEGHAPSQAFHNTWMSTLRNAIRELFAHAVEEWN